MSAKIQVHNSSYNWLRVTLVLESLLLGEVAACAPVIPQTASPATPTFAPTAPLK